MALKLLLNGSRGRMGVAIRSVLNPQQFNLICELDEGDSIGNKMKTVDVAIDFSFKEATLPLVERAAESGVPVVIGTTGHTPEERRQILSAATGIPVVWSGNYSIGMNLLFHLTSISSKTLDTSYEPEISETHHHHKKDAPSGTAVDLARRICEGRNWVYEDVVVNGREGMTGERPPKQLGIHALRGGDVVGEHIVSFFGSGERIELRHLATDRKIFAHGAVAAAAWVVGKKPGLYEMQDVLNLR